MTGLVMAQKTESLAKCKRGKICDTTYWILANKKMVNRDLWYSIPSSCSSGSSSMEGEVGSIWTEAVTVKTWGEGCAHVEGRQAVGVRRVWGR